jgi:hypothetical protein
MVYQDAIICVVVATKSTKKRGKTRLMVKKATAKKAEKNLGGRPRRDPATLRTERLVLRIHPDLMYCLTELAKENGLTRSMLVERAMVTFVNLSAGEPILDTMGRRLHGPESENVLGTPASFQHVWSRVVGVPPANSNPQAPRWVRPGKGDRSGDDGT